MAPRAARLAASLDEHGLDLLLVTTPVNLRYLTGFTGSNGLALIGRDTRRFLTDFRYVEQVAEQVTEFEAERGDRDLLGDVERLLPEGELRIGFESSSMPVAKHERLRELLPERVTLVPAPSLVERQREIKEPEEVDAIRAAAQLADGALSAVLEDGLVGRTEREVAWALEREIRERGAQAVSFPPIIAAAGHGALPHAEPRDVPIPRDALVVVDWGAELDGYCSDCTRTFATGELSPAAIDGYTLVLRAQLVSLEGAVAGRTGPEVDGLARKLIEDAGEGDNFGHGLGHGVGLEVHEGPTLSHRADDRPLRDGNVVTVEPGVYHPGDFGVRIEDLIVVRDGGQEVLTSLPKDLQVVL